MGGVRDARVVISTRCHSHKVTVDNLHMPKLHLARCRKKYDKYAQLLAMPTSAPVALWSAGSARKLGHELVKALDARRAT